MAIKTLLWLDDIRNPYDNEGWLVFSPIERPFTVHWVKDYNSFVGWIIEHGLPDGICFDHDLGDCSMKTGYDCAKWLVDYCQQKNIDIPAYNIQSANPVGKSNINFILASYRKHRKQEQKKAE